MLKTSSIHNIPPEPPTKKPRQSKDVDKKKVAEEPKLKLRSVEKTKLICALDKLLKGSTNGKELIKVNTNLLEAPTSNSYLLIRNTTKPNQRLDANAIFSTKILFW